MIKQKYGSKFFVENYPLYWRKMFNKYYDMLKDQYRFMISISQDFYGVGYNNTEIYRSNNSLEEIIKQLDNMTFQVAYITDFKSKFPKPYEYTYYKMRDMQYITASYMLRQSESVQMYKSYPSYKVSNKDYKKDGNFYYKTWNKYSNNTKMNVRISEYAEVTYNNIKMICTIDNELYAYQYTLVDSPKVEINTDHLNKIKRVLKAIEKDNINGFFDDMIERIKDSFGIR